MIDPKELRIGNLVNTEYGVDEVMSIDHETLEFHAILTKSDHLYIPKHMGVNISCELIDPIPITPEWLERLGCIIDDNEYRFELPDKKTVIVFCKEEMHCELGHFYSDQTTYMPENKYVHQLQNLIFALTGEELTIKQPEHET